MKSDKEKKKLVGLRMPTWLKKELLEISEKNERTLTQQILFVLKTWVAENGKPSE